MNVLSSMALAVLAAAFAARPVHALDAAAERAEHDRIKSERDQAEAAFLTREHECRERFVVTPCIDQAKHDRRQTMERLRQQQAVLDEAQRKQRAAQRIDDIRTKVSGDDAKQREAMARGRRKEREQAEAIAAAASAPAAEASGVESPASVASVPAASAASAALAAPSRAAPARASLPSQEAKHVADYERRQQEAKAHAEAVERRNAERAASGKAPAKGLPVPAASAAQ